MLNQVNLGENAFEYILQLQSNDPDSLNKLQQGFGQIKPLINVATLPSHHCQARRQVLPVRS